MHRPEPNFNVEAQIIKQAEQNPGNTAIIFEGNTTGKVLKFQLRESLV